MNRHEHLKDVPVAYRPKMLPLFPWGTPYFRAWRSLRWFLGLLFPIAGSALSLWHHQHGIGLSLLVGLVVVYISACLFVALCSGMVTSNWGTYFRQTEPSQFGLHIVILGMLYLGLSCVGYFV